MNIPKLKAAISGHESFWVNRLINLNPLSIPFAKSELPFAKNSVFACTIKSLSGLEKIHSLYTSPSDGWQYLYSTLVTYFARLNGIESFDIGYRDGGLDTVAKCIGNQIASYVPCRFDLDLELSPTLVFQSVLHQVRETKKHISFYKDIATRHAELSHAENAIRRYTYPVVIQIVGSLEIATICPGSLLTIVITEDGRDCRWLYNMSALDDRSIILMKEQFDLFLQHVHSNSIAKVRLISLQTKEQLDRILVEWNDTKICYHQTKQIPQLFEDQTSQTPDHVAVEFEENRITYRDLNRKANQVAHYLRNRGVKPEVVVGICLEPSLEMIIGILGILKAGGVSMPIDPSSPLPRFAYMLEDAKVSLLLTQEKLLPLLQVKSTVICLDSMWDHIAKESDEDLEAGIVDTNLIYIIYTSGSTGNPKGVSMSHASLSNVLEWQRNYFNVSQPRRTLQFSSISFDVSFHEVLSTLCTGGCLVLVPKRLRNDIWHLGQFIARKGIERLFLPFTALQHIAEAICEQGCFPKELKEVVTTGEQLHLTKAIKAMFANLTDCLLINQYGPTETHFVTAYTCPVDLNECPAFPPIGRPIANTELYILDKYMQPVPIGIIGELYAGGIGLAREYLNQPRLTAEKFIRCPFATSNYNRLYRTGDLAQYNQDGTIEFMGRTDHQVKVRGYRIELKEVERLLCEIPSVHQALVLAQEDDLHVKRLIAFVVPAHGFSITACGLSGLLKLKMPAYMVPSDIIIIKSLPRTLSGKINRNVLSMFKIASIPSDNSLDEPRTLVECRLARIWAEVLNLMNIGVNDNYFDLGGDSIQAAQIIARVSKELAVELSFSMFFDSPTIRGLGTNVLLLQESHLLNPSLTGTWMKGDIDKAEVPLTTAQQQLFLLGGSAIGSPSYNISDNILFFGRLDISALSTTLDEILSRHEVLRVSFRHSDLRLVQFVRPVSTISIPIEDIECSLDAQQRSAVVSGLLVKEGRRQFDLLQAPLIRFKLFRLSSQFHILHFSVHHLAFDGWSLNVFFREISSLYNAILNGQSSSLPKLPMQYLDYAAWDSQRIIRRYLKYHSSSWDNQLVLNTSPGLPRQGFVVNNGSASSIVLSRCLTSGLKAFSRKHGVTLFMILLAAFQLLLTKYLKYDDIVLACPLAGRESVATESLIGCFINTLIFNIDLTGVTSFCDLVYLVRDASLEEFSSPLQSFEKLVGSGVHRSSSCTSIPPIAMFIFQNTPSASLQLQGLRTDRITLHNGTSKFDLTMAIAETNGELRIALEYNLKRISPGAVDMILAYFKTLLGRAVEDSSFPLDELP
jgi:amino acid adenylation domain-containing protein